MYNLHEEVNRMLGKKSNLTFEDVRERYEHFRARCGKQKNKKLEKGCTSSIYGKNTKCVLTIVPKETNIKTFVMKKNCKCTKVIHKK